MQNNDKKYFILVDGTPIEVSEDVYRAYYQPIWNTRYHAQQNGECRCTKAQLWKCDGVCPGCPLYAAGKTEREIAADMGKRQSTINYQKNKVFSILREALKDFI